jgi:hypothetical protein
MPESSDKRPVTEQELNSAVRNFESSELARSLNSYGVDIERIDGIPTNFRRITSVQSRLFNSNADRNLTLMGDELFVRRANVANAGYRVISREYNEYVNWCEKLGFTGRTFWHNKEREGWNTSKASWDAAGAAETIAHYTGNLGTGKTLNVELLRDNIMAVLEKWNHSFESVVIDPFEDFPSWTGQMNWNRNSGWPFHMPISQERYMSVDLPNWYPWYARLFSTQTIEALEEFMETAPVGWGNVNANIYTMFGRPEDRVIHGVEHVWKGPGAYFNNGTTSNMKQTQVAWTSTSQNHEDQSKALAFHDAIIMADDIRKYDRNFERVLMQLIYDCVKESDHLVNHPHMRKALLALLNLFTKNSWLHLSATHRVVMVKGLPSGHPLTQWIGSLVHLALYDRWTELYGIESSYDQVLSDDGFRIIRGMTLTEAENLCFGDMAEDAKNFGFTFHEKKTIVVDPTDEHTVGYRTDLERDVVMGDSAFFLKQFGNRDLGAAQGNSQGMLQSMLEVERNASDEFRESVDPHLLGFDVGLGGRVPTAIYDLARLVDIIASGGIGNPLIDSAINYVQTTWPGFATRGVKILEEKLDKEWRSGTTRYAGGTLDSGIARKRVVEELLDLEREPIWQQKAFASKVA